MLTSSIHALTPDELDVAPGIGAFTMFFILGIALALLVWNMSKHLRKVDRHRIEAEVRAEFEAAKLDPEETAEDSQASELSNDDEATSGEKSP